MKFALKPTTDQCYEKIKTNSNDEMIKWNNLGFDFKFAQNAYLLLLVRLCDVTVAAEVECVVIVEFDSFDDELCTLCTCWILLNVGWRFWCCVFDGNLQKEEKLEWKLFPESSDDKVDRNRVNSYRVVNVVVVSVAVLVRCPFILLSVSFNLNWNE